MFNLIVRHFFSVELLCQSWQTSELWKDNSLLQQIIGEKTLQVHFVIKGPSSKMSIPMEPRQQWWWWRLMTLLRVMRLKQADVQKLDKGLNNLEFKMGVRYDMNLVIYGSHFVIIYSSILYQISIVFKTTWVQCVIIRSHFLPAWSIPDLNSPWLYNPTLHDPFFFL